MVARHEYLVGVRRPGFLIMTALIPALGLVALLVAAFFGGRAASFLEAQFSPEAERMGVVDHTGLFIPVLPEYGERFINYPDQETGVAALRADEITTLLIIPDSYVGEGEVRVLSKGSGLTAAAIQDSELVRAFMVDHLLREQVEEPVRQRAAHPLEVDAVVLSESGEAEGGGPLSIVGTFVVPYAMAFLLVMTIFVSSGYLLQGVAEEKESRIIEIVLSSITARELLAGKLVGLGALGLTQILIWIISLWALSGGALTLLALTIPLLARPWVIVLALLYYLLGFLLYAALMAAAGSLGTTQRESQQLAGVFSIMAAVPFMVSGFMFANPDALIVRVLSWFPLSAPTMMMMRLPLAEVPWIDVAGSALVLLASVPAALWAGAKVFRMGLLMYGKRPGLGEVWRALREA